MKFKITFSEAIYFDGKLVSDVTYYIIENYMTDYWTFLADAEKLKNGHKNIPMVDEYTIEEQDLTDGKKGKVAILQYYYAPKGYTMLRGVSYERLDDDDTPINDVPTYV